MKTHSSLDICSLPHKVKTALCNTILKQPLFEYYPSSDEEEQSNDSFNYIATSIKNKYRVHANRGCSRRKVNLGIREIETLKAQYFAMWKCPKVEVTREYLPTYYIAKYHLEDALLLFKTADSLRNDDIIFPEAVAAKIKREILAQIVLHDMMAH